MTRETEVSIDWSRGDDQTVAVNYRIGPRGEVIVERILKDESTCALTKEPR